jgi:hypothetical protein
MRRDPIKTVSFAANPHMEFLITQWNIGIYELYLNVNEGKKNGVKLAPASTIAQQKMGSPSTSCVWGVYDLREDQALVIEQDVPRARYWSYLMPGASRLISSTIRPM